MSAGRYVLKDGRPTPEPDLYKWAEWFEESLCERVVDRTKVGSLSVSTVFLALDHNLEGGEPLLYETMIFRGSDAVGVYQERYHTKDQALEGHRLAVEWAETYLAERSESEVEK